MTGNIGGRALAESFTAYFVHLRQAATAQECNETYKLLLMLSPWQLKLRGSTDNISATSFSSNITDVSLSLSLSLSLGDNRLATAIYTIYANCWLSATVSDVFAYCEPMDLVLYTSLALTTLDAPNYADIWLKSRKTWKQKRKQTQAYTVGLGRVPTNVLNSENTDEPLYNRHIEYAIDDNNNMGLPLFVQPPLFNIGSQICEITRNSEKIPTCNSSR